MRMREKVYKEQERKRVSMLMVDCAFSVGGTLPSTCSTPPPPFDDAVRSNDQTLASGGHHPHHFHHHHHHQQQGSTSPSILTSSLAGSHAGRNKVVHHVTLPKTYHDTVRYVVFYIYCIPIYVYIVQQ